MGRLELVPFADEHVDDAARLLAVRHHRHRRDEPLLPERYEDPDAAAEVLLAVWRTPDASGAAAIRDDRVTGYLVGAPDDPATWGENIWVHGAGHAVESPEDARDLYAAAASRWVEEGRRRHYALVPATDDALVDAWFRLGFGHQQSYAVREVGPTEVANGFEIREPREADVEGLIEIDLALPRHQRASPVFSEIPMPSAEDVRAEWRKTLAGDDEKLLIGFADGRPVACWSTCDARLSTHFDGLTLPERAAYLAFAATVPEARGSGIGVALTAACIAAAHADGYAAMVTDWRVTNLLASRFWPRRGFRPMFFRLYRSIP